jgi:hypothetical protein
MVSDKMVVSFMERAFDAKNCIREGWLQCRRDYAVYLQGHGRVFVLFPSSFPWNKNDKYILSKEKVGINDEINVGPWNIVVKQQAEPHSPRSLLQTRAIPSFRHFMNGHVEYYLNIDETAGEIKPLSFCKLSKANRQAKSSH